MKPIVGRKDEKKILKKALASGEADCANATNEAYIAL